MQGTWTGSRIPFVSRILHLRPPSLTHGSFPFVSELRHPESTVGTSVRASNVDGPSKTRRMEESTSSFPLTWIVATRLSRPRGWEVDRRAGSRWTRVLNLMVGGRRDLETNRSPSILFCALKRKTNKQTLLRLIFYIFFNATRSSDEIDAS